MTRKAVPSRPAAGARAVATALAGARAVATALAVAAALAAAAPGTAAAQPGPVDPAAVAAVVTAEFTGDGGIDRAVLIDRDGDLDLVLYVSDPTGGPGLRWHATAERIGWAGGWGQLPELVVTEGGSLQLITQNEGVGRNRWREAVTFAWRDGEMIVAGYTWEERDTLTTEGGSCDVNLLTGKGEQNGRALRLQPARTSMSRWSTERDRPCD